MDGSSNEFGAWKERKGPKPPSMKKIAEPFSSSSESRTLPSIELLVRFLNAVQGWFNENENLVSFLVG